jgi:hypothetical protein
MDGIVRKENFNKFKEVLNLAELPFNIDCISFGDKMHFQFKFTQRDIDFWNNCSTGTHSFTLLYYWMQFALYDKIPPSLVFIDEFDAFYQERLSQFIIQELKKINNCQFILTNQDTHIMSNDLMRPDCLFLLSPDKSVSVEHSTDKDLSFAHNIEKLYRSGALDV